MSSTSPNALPAVDFFDTTVRITTPVRSLSVVFDHPVREVLVTAESIIARVEPPAGTVLNENIYGLSLEGDRLWTIGQLPHVYDDSPYTGLSRRIDGSVWASNWDGACCRLGTKSGAILEVVAGK
jgi:hypothetical protein